MYMYVGVIGSDSASVLYVVVLQLALLLVLLAIICNDLQWSEILSASHIMCYGTQHIEIDVQQLFLLAFIAFCVKIVP